MTEVRVSLAAVRRVWADRSLSLPQAAARLGVHPSTLSAWAARLGLPSRRFKASDDDISRLWADPALSTAEICARLGITRSNLWRRTDKLGLPRRSRVRRDAGVADWETFDDMWCAGVSLKEMARHFGRHFMTISAMSRQRGLPSRAHGGVRPLTLDDYAQLVLARRMAVVAEAEQRAMRLAGVLAGRGSAEKGVAA